MTQVCDSHTFAGQKLNVNPTPGQKFVDILRKIAVNDSTLFCRFREKLVGCSEIFVETITDGGVCSTFNMIPAKEMFKNDGNSVKTSWSENVFATKNFEVFPRRAFSGSSIGLNVVLNQKTSDLDFLCSGPVQGWKVKVHAPDEHPQMMSGFQRLSLKSEISIVVKPRVEHRLSENCHSSESKSLKYFNKYSQSNCIAECLSTFVLSSCGCVKFSMIHDNKTEICNQHQTECVADATKMFQTVERFNDDFSCDCKPCCSSLRYDTNVYQADFEFRNVFEAYQEDLNEFPSAAMSRLVVYIEDDFYKPTAESTVNSSLVENISRIGGILAFFLGASWISFVEVFYYIFRRFMG